jgi:hypothetical protein
MYQRHAASAWAAVGSLRLVTVNRTPKRRDDAELMKYRRDVYHCRLFIDDVESLIAYAEKSCDRVMLTVKGAALDSPEDIRDTTSAERHHLVISSVDPKFFAWLGRDQAVVVSNMDDAKARHVVDGLADLLRDRRSSRAFYTATWRSALLLRVILIEGLAIVLGVATWFAMWWSAEWIRTAAVAVVASFTTSLGVLPLLAKVPRTSAQIVPMRRSDQRGLSAQARTALWTGLVVGVIVAVITVGLTLAVIGK